MNILIDNCKISLSYDNSILSELVIISNDDRILKINEELKLFLELKNKFSTKLIKETDIFSNKFYEEKIKLLTETHNAAISNLNELHNNAIDNLSSYNNLKLEKLISEFQLKLEIAETKNIKSVEQSKQQYEYAQIYDLITSKLNTGGAIGALGENIIKNYYEEFAQFNNDIIVSNTSGIKEHGDLMIKYKTLSVSVEIKNYKSTIPVKEIDKFYKSMSKENYNAGIFISLNTLFNSKSNIKPIDFVIKHNKPIIFLSNINANNKLILLLALELLYIYNNSSASQEATNTEYINFIKDQMVDLTEMILDLDKQKQLITKQEMRINKMKNSIIKILNINNE